MNIDATDRKILKATAPGLPLTPHPFAEVGRWLELPEDEVIARIEAMQRAGIIRRVALAPNHFALGLGANGMSVWDVDDARAGELGEAVGALPFVSHCYLRPRSLPDWPYNLFAMIHGTSREAVETQRETISAMLGAACRTHDILFSTRILKKTGMRLANGG